MARVARQPTTGERIRPYRHGDLRRELLSRAEQALRQRGTVALSVRELTRDIGVSVAAPSRHFKSKRDLLAALALVGFERLAEAIASSQEGVGATFAERLEATTRAFVNFALANSALLDLMYPVGPDHAVSDALEATSHRWVEEVGELIGEGQRRGEVRRGPVPRVALPVFALLHGYARLAASGALPPESVEQGLDDIVTTMLRACRPD